MFAKVALLFKKETSPTKFINNLVSKCSRFIVVMNSIQFSLKTIVAIDILFSTKNFLLVYNRSNLDRIVLARNLSKQ